MGTIVYDGRTKKISGLNSDTSNIKVIDNRVKYRGNEIINSYNKNKWTYNICSVAAPTILLGRVKNMPVSKENYMFIKDFLIDPKDYGYYLKTPVEKIESLLGNVLHSFNLDFLVEHIGVWQATLLILFGVGVAVLTFVESSQVGKLNKKKDKLDKLNLEIGLINAEKELARLKDPITAEIEAYERENQIRLYNYIKEHSELRDGDILKAIIEFKELDNKLKSYKINEILDDGSLDDITNM